MLILRLLVHLNEDMAEVCHAGIRAVLLNARVDADIRATAILIRPHAADGRREVVLNPFVALEERTLGVWPTSTVLVADDVVTDADNLIRLEAGFEEVARREWRWRLRY